MLVINVPWSDYLYQSVTFRKSRRLLIASLLYIPLYAHEHNEYEYVYIYIYSKRFCFILKEAPQCRAKRHDDLHPFLA